MPMRPMRGSPARPRRELCRLCPPARSGRLDACSSARHAHCRDHRRAPALSGRRRNQDRPVGGLSLESEAMSTSYAPEVIADSSGKWTGNGLRFATRDEAMANVTDLMFRWTAVREIRVVESDDPVNYRWDPYQGLVRLESEAKA